MRRAPKAKIRVYVKSGLYAGFPLKLRHAQMPKPDWRAFMQSAFDRDWVVLIVLAVTLGIVILFSR